MFERFIQPAGRSLFFARYEASLYGSDPIDLDHLRLGILRERSEIDDLVDAATAEALRQLVVARIVRRPPTPTSMEIPFSHETKRALERAAVEADLLAHPHIGTEHLLLATLVVQPLDLPDSAMAYALDADRVRNTIRERPSPSRG